MPSIFDQRTICIIRHPLHIAFVLFCSCSMHVSHAAPSSTIGEVTCNAKWNELCEDKKILSMPENHRLCEHEITVTEKTGDASYQVVGSDDTSITIYFRAKGNLDRNKPQPASIKLDVHMKGVPVKESCAGDTTHPASTNTVTTHTATTPAVTPVEKAPSEPANTVTTPSASSPLPETAPSTHQNLQACACSQWLNWMNVERCLERGKGKEGVSCDSYPTSIQCVSSKAECQAIHKNDCPQVVGLNQSTSLKRLFIENSPYCLPQ